MGTEDRRFGSELHAGRVLVMSKRSGPRELGGAVDLVNKYKLWPHYESFCKGSIPLSISETRYLHNVVGDIEIKKGDGAGFNELLRNASNTRGRTASIDLFDLDTLKNAFHMRETTSVQLPRAENDLKEKEKKRKKLKSKDKRNKKGDKKDKHPSSKKRRVFDGFEGPPVSGIHTSVVTESRGQKGSWVTLR